MGSISIHAERYVSAAHTQAFWQKRCKGEEHYFPGECQKNIPGQLVRSILKRFASSNEGHRSDKTSEISFAT